MGKLFGTDGVRGIVNRELTGDLAYKIGKAGGYVLSEAEDKKPLILIAKDTRKSCDMLENALTAGILSAGGNVIQLGVLPTPGVAYLVRKYKATAGVMISASHNPAEYNGIKFFDSRGLKLTDEAEEAIEALAADDNAIPMPDSEHIGSLLPKRNAQKDYTDFLKSTVSCDFGNLTIAIDCANGATASVAEAVFSQMGATIWLTANQPDGTNINKECGSTHIENICRYTREHHADLGIAFDGDGDRVLLCDEQGNSIDGDQILAILGLHLKKQGKLSKNTLVATVMSNLSLSLFGKANGIQIRQTKVGDRYVLEEMRKEGYSLGGEQSGHIILLEESSTGDGILTAMKLLEIMKTTKASASQLAALMTPLPQILLNVTVQNHKKEQVLSDPEVSGFTKTVCDRLGDNGRVLLRSSGTEPVFRVMLEGKKQDEISRYAHQIADIIAKKFG